MNPLQNAGREFQRELQNGSLNDSDLTWGRNLLLQMLQAVNARLGVAGGHMVAEESMAKLETDAQQVVKDVQEIEQS